MFTGVLSPEGLAALAVLTKSEPIKVEPLDRLFARLPQKFTRLHYSTYHLVRSLGYFAEAEQEPEPMLIQPVTWQEVTAFFRREQGDMMRQFKQKSPI